MVAPLREIKIHMQWVRISNIYITTAIFLLLSVENADTIKVQLHHVVPKNNPWWYGLLSAFLTLIIEIFHKYFSKNVLLEYPCHQYFKPKRKKQRQIFYKALILILVTIGVVITGLKLHYATQKHKVFGLDYFTFAVDSLSSIKDEKHFRVFSLSLNYESVNFFRCYRSLLNISSLSFVGYMALEQTILLCPFYSTCRHISAIQIIEIEPPTSIAWASAAIQSKPLDFVWITGGVKQHIQTGPSAEFYFQGTLHTREGNKTIERLLTDETFLFFSRNQSFEPVSTKWAWEGVT